MKTLLTTKGWVKVQEATVRTSGCTRSSKHVCVKNGLVKTCWRCKTRWVPWGPRSRCLKQLQQDEIPEKGGRPSLSPPVTPEMPTKFASRSTSLVVAGLVKSVMSPKRVVVRKVSLKAPASRVVKGPRAGKVSRIPISLARTGSSLHADLATVAR